MPRPLRDLSEEELAQHVVRLLEVKTRIHEIFVRQGLKHAIWETSNRKGRRDNCNNWSTLAALERLKWGHFRKVDWPKDHQLVHEHIVPRRCIENALYGLREPTIENTSKLLNLSETCIVTKVEDERLSQHYKSDMPEGWQPVDDDKWARYTDQKVSIRCIHVHPVEFQGTLP